MTARKRAIASMLILFPLFAFAESFPKSAAVKPDGKEADVIVSFNSDRMVIVPKDGDELAGKEFTYGDIKSGEYSFSKSLRYKTAILVSPVFLFSRGKKHWFTIVGSKESTVLHLDKKNYKAILAAFESHTGLKVETAGEEK